jgi:hypothetical protein
MPYVDEEKVRAILDLCDEELKSKLGWGIDVEGI